VEDDLTLVKWDEAGHSTNGWIDSDEFPTIYFAASWVVQFVSGYTVILLCTPPVLACVPPVIANTV